MPMLPEDAQVPGGVYLCQAGPDISCGSCCGLYNMTDLRRERLRNILLERTERFAAVTRNVDAILAFEQERFAREGTDYPLADFHHCVFVGLIQDGGERVGCLLHPLALGNGGVDWRGLSFYGGAACKLFFCPSHHLGAAKWKRVAREVVDDWFDYGLIAPEYRLNQALIEEVEARAGRGIDPDAMDADLKAALAALFRLKVQWPFRAPDAPVAWNFFSTRNTDRRERLGSILDNEPRLRTILHELDTQPEHVPSALRLLEERLTRAAEEIRRGWTDVSADERDKSDPRSRRGAWPEALY